MTEFGMFTLVGEAHFRHQPCLNSNGAGSQRRNFFRTFYVLQNVLTWSYKSWYINQGSSRTGTHGNAVPVLFYTTGTPFPFFLGATR